MLYRAWTSPVNLLRERAIFHRIALRRIECEKDANNKGKEDRNLETSNIDKPKVL